MTAVSVTPNTGSVAIGASITLSASVTQSNCSPVPSVTWASSNTAAATVSASGVVSGVTAGSAIITATAAGQSGQATITVTPVPVASVLVTPTNPSIQAGQTVQLAVATRDAQGNVLAGRSVAWSSANPSIATVSNTGLVTGLTGGTTQINAISEGVTGSVTLTVIAVPVATITLSLSSPLIEMGTTATLAAEGRSGAGAVLTGRTFAWTSSDISVATVSASGVISALAPGTAIITAAADGVTGTFNIRVTPTTENKRFAYAWASQPTAPIGVPYTPDAAYRFNASGGTIQVTRQGVGNYRLTFGRLAKSGVASFRENVLVTAYGSAGETCRVAGWSDNDASDLGATVTCVNIAGTTIDAYFNILVVGSGTLGGRNAFAWNPNPNFNSSGSGTSSYAFSSTGGGWSMAVTGTGEYFADLGITGLTQSTVIVSNYQAGACRLGAWNHGTGLLNVRCALVPTHAPANASFTALILDAGRTGQRWAYLWNHDPAAALNTPYPPGPTYSGQSNGQQPSITRTGTGAYTVVMPGLGKTSSVTETFMVTSYGVGATGACQSGGWATTGAGDLSHTVYCWNAATGARADMQFSMLMIQ